MALQFDDAAAFLPEASLAPAIVTSRVTTVADDVELGLYGSIAACEALWRDFEATADHTVFQSFGWLSAWMRNIGEREGIVPAIVVGRDPNGAMLFLMPFAIERQAFVRRLTWLGTCLADYNAPLLAPTFASTICERRFATLWKRILAALMADTRFRHDAICLEKMPDTVGGQRNPFTWLSLSPHPSGAHLAALFGDWESYYSERRSAGTRKNDRAKRRKLGEFGEVRYVEPASDAETRCTLAALFAQKSRQFARMGVADVFARHGHAEFYLDLATGRATRDFVHVSHLAVGDTVAAANFGTIYRGRYYHLIAAYTDGDMARFGPGAAHLRDLMRTAIERGCREFDFTIGDEAYKREWSDRAIALHDLHAATTPAGWLVAAAVRAYARAKRFIKQTPMLWRAFTRTRALSGLVSRRSAAETATKADPAE